jgi:hypothetical protein
MNGYMGTPSPAQGISNTKAGTYLDTYYIYSFDGKLMAEYDHNGNCVRQIRRQMQASDCCGLRVAGIRGKTQKTFCHGQTRKNTEKASPMTNDQCPATSPKKSSPPRTPHRAPRNEPHHRRLKSSGGFWLNDQINTTRTVFRMRMTATERNGTTTRMRIVLLQK